MLLIRPLGTNFSEILIEIQTFSFMKELLKVSSAKNHHFVSTPMSPGLTNHEVCNGGKHSDRNHSHWHHITDDLRHKIGGDSVKSIGIFMSENRI